MEARGVKFFAYVEGVAIQFIGGSVNATMGSLSSAVISVPFSQFCTQLRPRSIITITYGFTDDKTKEEINEYVLFDGELVSIQISGTGTSRSCVIRAQSPMASLTRYRKNLGQSVSTPILSAAYLHLYIQKSLVLSDLVL